MGPSVKKANIWNVIPAPTAAIWFDCTPPLTETDVSAPSNGTVMRVTSESASGGMLNRSFGLKRTLFCLFTSVIIVPPSLLVVVVSTGLINEAAVSAPLLFAVAVPAPPPPRAVSRLSYPSSPTENASLAMRAALLLPEARMTLSSPTLTSLESSTTTNMSPPMAASKSKSAATSASAILVFFLTSSRVSTSFFIPS